MKSISSTHLTLASFCTIIASEKHKTSSIGNSASQPCLQEERTKYAIQLQLCEKYAFFMRPTTLEASRSMTGLNKREESSIIIFTSFREYDFALVFMIKAKKNTPIDCVKNGRNLSNFALEYRFFRQKITIAKYTFCIRKIGVIHRVVHIFKANCG